MPTVEETLTHRLRDLEAGGTRVLDAHVRHGEDSEGEPALFLELTLTNPPEGSGTWPVDDIWDLRRRVRDIVAHLNEIDQPWFIAFRPRDTEDFAPEDTGEQLDI